MRKNSDCDDFTSAAKPRASITESFNELNEKKKQKIFVTGDDIVIEYVRRIKNELKLIKDPLPSSIEIPLVKFLNH